MRKILIFALFFITIVSSYALELEYYEKTFDITEKTLYNHSINVWYDLNTTPFNFTIYNLTFTKIPHFYFDTIHNLSRNQSKSLNFSIKTNTTLNTQFISRLKFHYLTNTTADRTNHSVQINQSGFDVFELELYVNDTIVFTNKDSINHTITDLGNQDKFKIQPNQTHYLTLIKFENKSYVDEESSVGLKVVVNHNNILKPTINPSWYVPISFQVNAVYQQSSLETTLTPPTSPISYDSQSSGVLILRPFTPVFGLELSSDDWLVFSNNSFNLDKETIIIFTVNPQDITETSQTNKSYTKTIEITAENIESQTLNFSIFIEHSNLTDFVDGDNVVYVDRPMTPQQTYDYCEQNNRWDDLDLCKKYLKNVTKIEYQDRTINPDITEKSLIDYFDKETREESDTTVIKTKLDEYIQKNNENTDFLSNKVEEVTKVSSTNTEKIDVIYNILVSEKKEKNVRSLSVGFIFISLIGLGVLAILGKRKFDKRLKSARGI